MLTPNILWITDPWSTLDHEKDTTLRLMHEAINMGIPTFWSPSDQVQSASTTGYLSASRITHIDALSSLDQIQFELFSVSTFQQVHDRVDPPVDARYRELITSLLRFGVRSDQILNPPELIQFQSEKIPPIELSAFAPKMKVVHSANQIPELIDQFANEKQLVTKPLNLAQSIGVEKHNVPKSTDEWNHLLNQLKPTPEKPVLFEEYLNEVNTGEVRLWFAGKILIGALKKFPIQGDFRVLVDQGSRIEAHEPSSTEIQIAHAIGTVLEKKGILLAAVDLIGNKICDFNITSPGLLVQLEKVHGKNFAREILNQALQYHAQKVRE